MSDEVQPPQFGDQPSAVPGGQTFPVADTQPSAVPGGQAFPGTNPAPGPNGGWSPPGPGQQPAWGEPTFPGQPYHPQPGEQPAGYPPYGAQPAWGIPQAPAARRNNRRLAILGGSIGALVVVGILIAVFALSGNGKSSSVPIAGSGSPSAPIPSAPAQSAPTQADTTTATTATTADTTTTPAMPLPACATAASVTGETVGYVACGSAAKNVGVPTYDSAQAHRTYTVTLKTNHGDIVFTATGAKAPYTVFNFIYLAQKQYFDSTRCHRLTTKGIYVLQCGDPTGTGTGTPGYQFQDENLNAFGHVPSGDSVTYPAGTVAMANAGYGTNGSQFFLVYRSCELPPLYTPFGAITQGMGILTSIAAQGTDNANSDGDGSPVEPVMLQQVTVSAS